MIFNYFKYDERNDNVHDRCRKSVIKRDFPTDFLRRTLFVVRMKCGHWFFKLHSGSDLFVMH